MRSERKKLAQKSPKSSQKQRTQVFTFEQPVHEKLRDEKKPKWRNPREREREREREKRVLQDTERIVSTGEMLENRLESGDKTLIMAEGFRVFRETLKPKPFCFVFFLLSPYCECFASAKYVEANKIADNLLFSSFVNKDIDRLCEGRRRRRKGSNRIPCSCLLLI